MFTKDFAITLDGHHFEGGRVEIRGVSITPKPTAAEAACICAFLAGSQGITATPLADDANPSGRPTRPTGYTSKCPDWSETCDWGDCDDASVAMRWDDRLKQCLSVCAGHQITY